MENEQDIEAALFISLSNDIGVLPNPGVLRFKTTADAEEFLFQTLVECDELRVDSNGSIWFGEYECNNRSEAIKEWQGCLGASEYFHIYECRDMTVLRIAAT